MVFLLTFFILPLINLAQTSTQTPVGGGDTGQYEQTLRFQNYFDAFIENREQFGRSFLYATIATVLALLIAYPLAYAIAFKGGKYKNHKVTRDQVRTIAQNKMTDLNASDVEQAMRIIEGTARSMGLTVEG